MLHSRDCGQRKRVPEKMEQPAKETQTSYEDCDNILLMRYGHKNGQENQSQLHFVY